MGRSGIFTLEQDKIMNLWVLGDVYGLLEQLARNQADEVSA
jgi:hypothetical protein